MLNVIRAAMASALLAVAASSVVAQALQPAASSASATPGSAAAKLVYRSAFEGYKPHTDQPVGSWLKANDLVGRIGGWRAYAREGQGETQPTPNSPASPSSAAKATSSAPASSQAKGAPAEGRSTGHSNSHPDMKKP
jgi:hypothetical protein